MKSPSLMQSLAQLLLSGASVLLVSKVLPGIRVRSYLSAVAFAFVAGILNTLAWQWLAVLTVPFSFLTLGLGVFVINGLLFLFAGSIIPGIEISGCVTASFASMAVTFTSWILRSLLLYFFR
jgi:putative membrane protein